MVLSIEYLNKFFALLDNAFLLENKRFDKAYRDAVSQFRAAPARSPIMLGTSYQENPKWIERQFQEYIDQLPVQRQRASRQSTVRGLISPHIDFQRGGCTYAEVWHRAAQAVRSADLAIVLGTNHQYAESMITLTRQSYATPWGIVPNADDIIDTLARELGDGIFSYELNHRMEHSVEAAVTWLHFLTKHGKRSPRIVPIICGSLTRFIEGDISPGDDENISRFIDIIRTATSNRRTIVIAAGDLAHVGPAFGDGHIIDQAEKLRIGDSDRELITLITNGDAEGAFQLVNEENDRRRICGLSPIYLTLRLLGETRGEVTGYAQCPADQQFTSLVSICGIVFS